MNNLNTIFVLGYPRSGTTWFANLFNSHPDVAYRHEVIGRCFEDFPEELYANLKYNHGLSDAEYQQAIDVVVSPKVDTDTAPFFPKNHLRVDNVRFHYLSWLVAKMVRPLQPLYKWFFYPKGDEVSLIIKETRSSVNMDSMLIGLRADRVVVLYRHPCGAILSHLKGIKSGAMEATDETERTRWYDDNIEKPYLSSLNISKDEILSVPEHIYLAIFWAQQNEDYLQFESDSYSSILVSYEAVMQNKVTLVKALFEALSLSYDPMVDQFLLSTSASVGTKPSFKDSSRSFYSVYRDEKFNPDKWKQDLTDEQITDIDRYTDQTLGKLDAKFRASLNAGVGMADNTDATGATKNLSSKATSGLDVDVPSSERARGTKVPEPL